MDSGKKILKRPSGQCVLQVSFSISLSSKNRYNPVRVKHYPGVILSVTVSGTTMHAEDSMYGFNLQTTLQHS